MINLRIYRETKSWKRPFHILRALLAKHYLKLLPKIEIIGITGSVGKTLTQNAIASVLSQKFKLAVGDENLDPTFRIPKTILSAKPWHQKLILEYGVEHPHDMDYYLSLIKPKIAVVTQITPTHLKYFKNIDGVYAEKSKLAKALPKTGCAVLNANDPYCHKMAKLTKAQIIWYGAKSKSAIKISHFSQKLSGSKFRMHFNNQKAFVETKIIGKHQLTSLLAAASVGTIYDLTLKQIAKGLSQAKPPTHRLSVITTKKVTIIDDTYNSSPQAAVEAIKTLVNVAVNKKKIVVLGEMKDLGNYANYYHQLLGQKIAKFKIDLLLTIGKNAKIVGTAAKKAKFKGKIINVATAQEAITKLKKIATPKGVILIKGSRHAHLERIVMALQGKSTSINCFHCGQLN